MHTIVLTRNDLVGTDNNRFVYDIPGAKALEGSEIALADLAMYYSWQNINDQPLFNNTFQIVIPALTQNGNGAALVSPYAGGPVTITIPNGLYEVADLQSYLEQWCILNNFYLVNDSTGEYVYFFQMQVNPTRYAIQFNSFALPYPDASGNFPAGYSQPPNGFLDGLNGVSYPNGAFPPTGTNEAPGWYFPAKFNEFAGFPSPVYVPDVSGSWGVFTTTNPFPTGNFSFLSTVAPNVQPNSVIFLNCNLIQNTFSNPQTFMYPVPAKVGIGQLLEVSPAEYAWNKLTPGVASQIIMTFTDSEGRPIYLQDPNTIIVLVVKDHSDKILNIGTSVTGGQPSSGESQRFMRNPVNHQSDTPHSNFARLKHSGR